MASTVSTHSMRDEVVAAILGIGFLCIGTVALIGAGGLMLWIAGVH
ncbi:MAG: hypothetical protein ACM33T_02410 [Solirubrobacterales bacterium]